MQNTEAKPDSDKPKTIRLNKAAIKLKPAQEAKIKICCSNCQSILKVTLEDGGLPVSCSNCNDYIIVPKESFAPSVVIGDFVIKNKLGAGGAGTVFLAYQRSLDRLCALKVLHDDVSGSNPLLKEARLAAKLNHPNVVQCYAITSEQSLCYYAMEYVKGNTLKSVLDKKWKLPPSKALNIVIQVAEALNYAWKESRITHHDVKPENIMMTEEGVVKLADMGLARLEHEYSHNDDENCLQGTPEYICPEEIRGGSIVDYRGDIYSLGVVLYKCVTGNLPFQSTDKIALMRMHLREQPPEPTTYTSSLPLEFNSLIMKMLEKNPEDRFPDYDDLLLNLKKLEILCNAIDLKDSSIMKLNESLDTLNSDKISRDLFKTTEHQLNSPAGTKGRLLKVAATIIITICSLGFISYAVMNLGSNKTNTYQEEPKKHHPIQVHDYSKLKIASLLPDPKGYDPGHEKITLINTGKQTITLNKCSIKDNSEKELPLKGLIQPGQKLTLNLKPDSINLDNRGDNIKLFDPTGNLIHAISYDKSKVKEDQVIVY